MSTKSNLGEAILILGCIYFIITYDIGFWSTLGIILLIILAVCTWEIRYHSKEEKRFNELNVEETKARTEMQKAQRALLLAQTLSYMKGRR